MLHPSLPQLDWFLLCRGSVGSSYHQNLNADSVHRSGNVDSVHAGVNVDSVHRSEMGPLLNYTDCLHRGEEESLHMSLSRLVGRNALCPMRC